MVRSKVIAALAALTAAGSLAIPVASASAQPAATAGARSAAVSYGPPFGPPGEFQSPFCLALVRQIQFATATGNLVWASALSQVFVFSHCGGAAL
jgi:hypothetical protein